MPAGRRPKPKPNTSGLWNHGKTPPVLIPQPLLPSSDLEDSEDDAEWDPHLAHDSLRPDFKNDIGESDLDEESEWEDCEDAGKLSMMRSLERALEAEARDGEWLPPAQVREKQKNESRKRPRPKEYKKGPDIMSKSECTRRRYKKLICNQTILNLFDFSCTLRPQPSTSNTGTEATSESESVPASPAAAASELAPAVPRPMNDIEVVPNSDLKAQSAEMDSPGTGLEGNEEEEEEAFEEEIMEDMGGGIEMRPWEKLCEQLQDDLKKKKNLMLAQINQLTILCNFTTLCLKGYGQTAASQEIARQWHAGEGVHFALRVCALARHYQIFEQLPKEKRGGSRNVNSHLHVECVWRATLKWLVALPYGGVTPQKFQHALNTTILPSLNIGLRRPLCERTACRWLVKLDWHRTLLWKGVYMDGHERPDVTKYRQEVFLPRMAEYECCMDQYEGVELKLVPPTLKPGEKKVDAIFHDESCFHVNEYKRTAWLPEGATILQKKGRGQLIHVSDFITEPTGHLVLRNDNGKIVEDACKIIFPGSNGDPWWDTAQLIEQVKRVIKIFEKVHPGCVALFIFDQSSAHASLPPDALQAFEMNKSNGGKQRKQRDTVIPQSNPDPRFRGQPQKMTLDNGEAKGLQQVPTERGFNVRKLRVKCAPVCPFKSQGCCMARLLSQQDDFMHQDSMLELTLKEAGHACMFLPKFHCELNPIEMYWGWAKYRYREVVKTNFEHAKRVALEALDSCPVEVIRRFIKRAWRFMTAWAVRKQKQHRQVSRRAMMAIEAVLNDYIKTVPS
ncbi:hypothetical protein K466DRAFT_579249 [Polyporus arcularius HHB13444]|uniref:Tc1-like transposase DDE domain-containing protein n=1 Tax=Polyporus arcularius HHB13444 TaxID=1314778 RepID=A0A5C3NPK1_9APHY|nr:hypothetical protein K466DRAFT_579249 [Polyporus arcularius HHB13444]